MHLDRFPADFQLMGASIDGTIFLVQALRDSMDPDLSSSR